MKTVLLLALAAVANAHYYDDVALTFAPVEELVPISPAATHAVFARFGFSKPAFDSNFISFARTLGVSDPAIPRLYSLYDEPAVLFFKDATGGIVSYFADSGLDRAFLSPELRTILPSVLGASDSMAIVYQPDTILGSYRSVLPGHFFAPSPAHTHVLVKMMTHGAFPFSVEHAILKKSDIVDIFPETTPVFARFDIDEFPFAYKSPVALSIFDVDHPVSIHNSFAKTFPFARSAIHTHPILKSAYPYSSSPLIPASSAISPAFYKSGFSLFRSELPTFASIPTLKFPVAKHLVSYEPLFAKPTYKVVHHPVSSVASIAAPIDVSFASPIATAAPAVEPFAVEESELRGFPLYFKSFPSYPTYPAYPAFRYPTPFYSSPIIPTAPIFPAPAAAPASIAGASAASTAAASASGASLF